MIADRANRATFGQDQSLSPRAAADHESLLPCSGRGPAEAARARASITAVGHVTCQSWPSPQISQMGNGVRQGTSARRKESHVVLTSVRTPAPSVRVCVLRVPGSTMTTFPRTVSPPW
jgi:hypothetical protein